MSNVSAAAGDPMDGLFPLPDVHRCLHEGGLDCDGLFHYCRRCAAPVDDCSCPR